MGKRSPYFTATIGMILAQSWVVAPSDAMDPYDPTDDLVAAFGSQCASTGALTNTALAQSESLEGVISAIKNDPLCRGVSSDSLNADLQQNIQAKLAFQAQQVNQQQLQGQILDLTAAIQTESAQPNPDANYISTLQQNLYLTQSTLLQAQQTAGPQKGQLTAARIASVAAHGTAFMDALAANSACLNAHPNALAQVGAQILSVSSVMAPGIMGSAMLTAGGLIDHFVQAMSNSGVNEKLKIIANSRLQHAIGCTFEGLASTYCQSRDVLLIQKANQEAQEHVDPCNTMAQGINLFSRDLAAFQTFVNNIYAGSMPSSPGTASEKSSVAYLQSELQSLQYQLDGETAKYQKNYNTSTTQSNKDNAVRSLIRELSNEIKIFMNSSRSLPSGGTQVTTGPIGDNFSDTVCGPMVFYYTNGVNNSCAPNANDAAGANPCETCIGRTYFPSSPNGLPPLPPISQLAANSAAILGLGATYVEQQELLYKQDNPQAALTSSETYGANLRKGKQFLENANTYLAHLLQEQDGIAKGQMLKSITNARKRITDVLSILDSTSGDPNSDPGKANIQLEQLLAPSTDQAYIPSEIQMIVKQDIDEKMHQGKIDPTVAAILQTSTSDSFSEFLNNYTSLEALRNQVREAKRMSKDNLDAMGQLFEPQMADMTKSMAKSAAADPSDEDLKDDLSLFCMQTLLIPSQPKGELSSRCKGLSYKSVYAKSGMKLDYDSLATQPFNARACSLYDFYRKSQLYGNGVPHSVGSAH